MLPSDLPDLQDGRMTDPHEAADEEEEAANDSKEASSSLAESRSNLANSEPPTSGTDSGRTDGPQNDQPSHDDPNVPQALPPLFGEIRYLQGRLLNLEAQAVQNFNPGLENMPVESSSSARPLDPGQDDWELRKRIRKAPSARQEAIRVETRAEKTTEERKGYGQAPNDVEFFQGYAYGRFPTMYHVRKDGTVFDGPQRRAPAGAWQYGQQIVDDGLDGLRDGLERQRHRPYPHRGIRPPTALRPLYRAATADDARAHSPRPATSSRKLGPPTEWDQSDSEEWSSDTSTTSQNFQYFRARLRGDFEWELDRLNAQVRRFEKHKAKKQSRLLALEAKEEDDVIQKQHFAQGTQGSLGGQLGVSAGGTHRGLMLNPVGWEMFRVARRAPREYRSVIDVLTEEPRIGTDQIRIPKSSTSDQPKITSKPGHKASATDKAEREEYTGEPSNQPGQWTGRGPLPERIRINSRSIIDSLSSIHGKALCEESVQSLTILRPFRILVAYDREIRDMSSNLMAAIDVKYNDSAPQADHTTQGIPLDTASLGHRVPEVASSTIEATQSGLDQGSSINREELAVKKEHLACLQEFMDDYTGRKMAYLNGTDCAKIVFSDLWFLFQPGTLVISADGKQAYQVVSIRSKRHKGTDRGNWWSAFHFPESEDSDSSTSPDGKPRHHDITIKCVFVHFDGHAIGPAIKTFGINTWDGEKDITFLEVYPLRLHILARLKERPRTSSTEPIVSEKDVKVGVETLQHRLAERGRRFVKVAAVKQMYYSGLAVNTRDEIESQVMIDFEAALSDETRKHWSPKIGRLVGTDWNPDKDETNKGCIAECCRGENIHNDAYVDKDNSQNFLNAIMAKIEHSPHTLPSAVIFPRSLDTTKAQGNEFTDEELMIMSYTVFGFVLRDRSWAELDLDCLSDVAASETPAEQATQDLDESDNGAFGQLVLPLGHKKMVLSLISQHFRNKASLDTNNERVDIVRGKGKGLIILLHGAPGVGKTTTAEGVAETFGKPLFQITCGDLGSSPKEVESALQTNFALANRWGCILLLDEADVFLAERKREDFNRNGMVAVFLRVLEYYAGILFLTTNRIGDFDEAFASRIHMSLHYPALDELSTMKVFRLNLGMIKSRLKDSIRIDEDEIISAAMKHWREHKDARWNGRQIRNACQTALALAETDAQPKGKMYNIKETSATKVHLTLDHLKIVSDSYLEFTDYLKAVHGADAEGRAKESGLRALDTLLEALKSSKGKNNDDGGSHSKENPRRPAGHPSPLQSFTLRSSPSGHQSSTMTPSTTEPAQPVPPPGWDFHQWSHEAPAFQTQRMHHYQPGFYTGNQPFGDPRTGTPTTQPGPAGHHLHPVQAYGSPLHGQRHSPSMQQTQASQPYGVPYPDVAQSPGSGATSSQGPAPVYHAGGDHSGQGQ